MVEHSPGILASEKEIHHCCTHSLGMVSDIGYESYVLTLSEEHDQDVGAGSCNTRQRLLPGTESRCH